MNFIYIWLLINIIIIQEEKLAYNNWIPFLSLLEKVLMVLHGTAWLSSKSVYGIPNNWTYFSELAMHVMKLLGVIDYCFSFISSGI